MEVVIEKAKNVAPAGYRLRIQTILGIAGYHAMQALAHDMIGLAMTKRQPAGSSTHAIDRMLGTNPIAVAIPAQEQPAFVADFATTTAANGKLEILQRKNLEAPRAGFRMPPAKAL
jgi:LDH2 family malate/lactate/ureidoglycolate dehydrogenase